MSDFIKTLEQDAVAVGKTVIPYAVDALEGKPGQPLLDGLYLAGEDGLKFLFGILEKQFGPWFEAEKAAFAKSILDKANVVIDDTIDTVKTDVDNVTPDALKPEEQKIEAEVEKSLRDKIAELESKLEGK